MSDENDYIRFERDCCMQNHPRLPDKSIVDDIESKQKSIVQSIHNDHPQSSVTAADCEGARDEENKPRTIH